MAVIFLAYFTLTYLAICLGGIICAVNSFRSNARDFCDQFAFQGWGEMIKLAYGDVEVPWSTGDAITEVGFQVWRVIIDDWQAINRDPEPKIARTGCFNQIT